MEGVVSPVNVRKLNPEAGPYAAYGARLRTLRQQLGWRQRDLAERVGYKEPHISGVEVAVKKPTFRFSAAVDTAMGLTNTEQSFELELRKIKFGKLLEGFGEYLTYEAQATEIRLYNIGIVPGLLQTEEYARALARANARRGLITEAQAEDRVRFLMERQQRVEQPQPPMMLVILDESCVLRPIGGRAVMEGQLEHLLDFAARPNTVLQVAPFEIGELRTFDLPVNLLTMPDREVVCYAEAQTQGHLERETLSVAPMFTAYHQLQAEAHSQRTSVALIRKLRKGTP